MNDFLERHVLHSLGIAKIMNFEEGTKVLDVGTGGGFPGIPLAKGIPGKPPPVPTSSTLVPSSKFIILAIPKECKT